jgi:hypothetical protein
MKGIKRVSRVKRFPLTDRLAMFAKEVFDAPDWMTQRYREANRIFCVTILRDCMK